MIMIKIKGKKKTAPIVHLKIYGLILKHSGGCYVIERKLIQEWIKRVLNPRMISGMEREEHLREMCTIGLFKRLNRDTYEITKIDFDKKKIFHKMGIPIDNYGNPLW